jgi:hypothetical protein
MLLLASATAQRVKLAEPTLTKILRHLVTRAITVHLRQLAGRLASIVPLGR